MQNETVKVMGLSILRKIASNIRSSLFYTIMVDETTDMANTEQEWFACGGLMKYLKYMKNLSVFIR